MAPPMPHVGLPQPSLSLSNAAFPSSQLFLQQQPTLPFPSQQSSLPLPVQSLPLPTAAQQLPQTAILSAQLPASRFSDPAIISSGAGVPSGSMPNDPAVLSMPSMPPMRGGPSPAQEQALQLAMSRTQAVIRTGQCVSPSTSELQPTPSTPPCPLPPFPIAPYPTLPMAGITSTFRPQTTR